MIIIIYTYCMYYYTALQKEIQLELVDLKSDLCHLSKLREEDFRVQVKKKQDSSQQAAGEKLVVNIMQVVRFDYGMKDENPVDKMRFYAKKNPGKAFQFPKERVIYLFTPHRHQYMHLYV